jgi:hypothetical protein
LGGAGLPGSSGQASVELLAILPAFLVCVVIAAQALPAGWALWSAADAARTGARAEHIGRDPEAAARGALPGSLREGADARGGERGVRVEVRAPTLFPGAAPLRLEAGSRLDPGDG